MGAWMDAESDSDPVADLHAVFADHHVGLVRLATFLLSDPSRAEEIVQDAFIDLYRSWDRIRRRDRVVAYVRRAVVSRSRSELRHRQVVRRHGQVAVPDLPSAESDTMANLEGESLRTALQQLPRRQREVLVLRYYSDLSEAEIASALSISRGSVKSHSSRGLRAMQQLLEDDS